MKNVIFITGVGGMLGSACARYFASIGYDIFGIDNNMREEFFGPAGSVNSTLDTLLSQIPDKFGTKFTLTKCDIRDYAAMNAVFSILKSMYPCGPKAIIHTAAQPSHDKAKEIPLVDFAVNATGTLNLLELTRQIFPDTSFIFTSTNKVYGDAPNRLPLYVDGIRYELSPAITLKTENSSELIGVSYHGISEQMSIDNSIHSVFGASKVAADVMVQEYGKYFGLRTSVFRGGCLVGPSQKGVELHGYLSYLVKCILSGTKYTIFGRGGLTVRDNIHSYDICTLFDEVINSNSAPGEVYNLGGERSNSSSMLEAIQMIQSITGLEAQIEFSDVARIGDHQWYITDMNKARAAFPKWEKRYGLKEILIGLVDEYRSKE